MSSSQTSVGGETTSAETSSADRSSDGAAVVCAARTRIASPRISLTLRNRGPDKRVLLSSGLPHPREPGAVGRPRREERVLHAGNRLLVFVLIDQHQATDLAIRVRYGPAA